MNFIKLENIKIIRSDERGAIYACGQSSFIIRKKGSTSANHTHEDPETTYLVEGRIELTIGNETQIIEAPTLFKIDPNEYHKVVALTDIKLITDRNESWTNSFTKQW